MRGVYRVTAELTHDAQLCKYFCGFLTYSDLGVKYALTQYMVYDSVLQKL